MDLKEAAEKLKDNPELAKSLEEALRRNVDSGELEEILASESFDAGAVEALIAEYQRKRGLFLAEDEVDEETLKQVAGGGKGTACSEADDCDGSFKNPEFWDNRCDYSSVCDEFFLG